MTLRGGCRNSEGGGEHACLDSLPLYSIPLQPRNAIKPLPPEQPALPETCATHARAPMQPHDNVVYAPQVNADCRGSERECERTRVFRNSERTPTHGGCRHPSTRAYPPRISCFHAHRQERGEREIPADHFHTRVREKSTSPSRLPPPSRSRASSQFAMPMMLRAHPLCLGVCVRVRVGHFLISEPRLQVIL